MIDPTAGRSAGTPLNAELDPMGRSDEENRRLASGAPRAGGRATNAPRDPTAGRSAETARNAEQATRVSRRADDPELPA